MVKSSIGLIYILSELPTKPIEHQLYLREFGLPRRLILIEGEMNIFVVYQQASYYTKKIYRIEALGTGIVKYSVHKHLGNLGHLLSLLDQRHDLFPILLIIEFYNKMLIM